MNRRDRIAARLVGVALLLATPRTRARVRVALIRAAGFDGTPEQLKLAQMRPLPERIP